MKTIDLNVRNLREAPWNANVMDEPSRARWRCRHRPRLSSDGRAEARGAADAHG